MQTGTVVPSRRRRSTIHPCEEAMLELNSLFTRIKTMQERVDALRGYL